MRARRRALGLTLQEVAAATNLSVGFISQVERDLTSPSLASLAAISLVLQTHVSEFLVMPGARSPVTRPDERNQQALIEGGQVYERISSAFPGHLLNAVIIHEAPGYRSELSRHEGEELYYILEGSTTIELEGERIILRAGDSMHFESGRSHSSWNHTRETTRILVVCTMDVFGESESIPDGRTRTGGRDKA
ncbi:MAG: XRE family transcriptional regulator [Albidovulum sp.]|nr:XRE family transcriptional regulator [Albidovulum sp.]